MAHRSPVAYSLGLLLLAWLAPARVGAQVPGQNINMVSGTVWPGGDPFLQRQNEPSLAVSSRNALHILAGANDYRTVDLPGLPNEQVTGDAWLGVFKSLDGGQTWQSTLLPGYPQDASPQGVASPLKGFTAAADPVVRPGTHGLFYFSGIVFNRGTNLGAVFVSRFMDLNNKENGDASQDRDPIRYVGAVAVDTGTSGQFLDKPWIASDVPRAGALSCSIPVAPGAPFPARCRVPGLLPVHGEHEHKDHVRALSRLRCDMEHPDQAQREQRDQSGDRHRRGSPVGSRQCRLAAVRVEQPGQRYRLHPLDGLRTDVRQGAGRERDPSL